MKNNIDHLESFDSKGKCLAVIVETPKGSRVKYSYDRKIGLGMVFPFNFGFVPKTLAADGDAVDVLILNEEPLISGCLLQVRPLAVIKATQTEDGKSIRNDRVIGRAIGKENLPELHSLELEKSTVSQVEFFFTTYNKLYGKRFNVIGTDGPRKAMEIVRQGAKLWQKQKHNEQL